MVFVGKSVSWLPGGLGCWGLYSLLGRRRGWTSWVSCYVWPLQKPLTSAVVKVDWYLSLPLLGQCCGINGSSLFSRGGLFQRYLGDVMSQGGLLFLSKERAVPEVGVRSEATVTVVAVVVFL